MTIKSSIRNFFIRFESSRPNIAGGVTLPDDVTLTPVDDSGDCQQIHHQVLPQTSQQVNPQTSQQISHHVFDHFDRSTPLVSSSNCSTIQSEGHLQILRTFFYLTFDFLMRINLLLWVINKGLLSTRKY